LFKKWKTLRIFNNAGPVSLVLSTGIEVAATLLSFGNGRIKELIYLVLCGLTFPVKYLDWFFINRRSVFSYAPGFCIVVEKSA
jgi:hypothetical protein